MALGVSRGAGDGLRPQMEEVKDEIWAANRSLY